MANDTTTKKRTFAESLADQEAVLSNSNLANLATALLRAMQAITEAQQLVTDIKDTAAKIEAGDAVDVSTIKKLYDAATASCKLKH